MASRPCWSSRWWWPSTCGRGGDGRRTAIALWLPRAWSPPGPERRPSWRRNLPFALFAGRARPCSSWPLPGRWRRSSYRDAKPRSSSRMDVSNSMAATDVKPSSHRSGEDGGQRLRPRAAVVRADRRRRLRSEGAVIVQPPTSDHADVSVRPSNSSPWAAVRHWRPAS